MLISIVTIVEGVCSAMNSKLKSQNLKMLFNRFNKFKTFKGLRFKPLRWFNGYEKIMGIFPLRGN